LGNALAVQLTTPLIYGSTLGYRTAYRLIATMILIAGLLIILLFKDAPAKVTSAATAKKKNAGWDGLSFAQCLRKPYFYAACIVIFFTGMVLQSVSGVAGAHMKDVGLDPDYVATVMSVYALCLAGFKFLSGFSHDKFGLGITLIICYCAAVIMSLLLAFMTNTPQGRVMAMAYAVIVGASLPLETVMLPLIAADLFGQKDYAKVMGIFVAVNTTGYAVGGPVTNLFFDYLGTYSHAFLIFSAVMVVLVIVFQFILNAAHRCSAQSAGSAGADIS
jgi:MFS family permease